MEKEKLQLLHEQVKILNGVIDVLRTQFGNVYEDEINFLSIVKGNLKENK